MATTTLRFHQVDGSGAPAGAGTGAASAGHVRRPGAALLARADAELLAAQFSSEAWERFSHAHLAAVRAAAAVVAELGTVRRRGAVRTVWEQLEAAAPTLAPWAREFAAAAGVRSALDAGRFDAVDESSADAALVRAEDFVDAVQELVGSRVTACAS